MLQLPKLTFVLLLLVFSWSSQGIAVLEFESNYSFAKTQPEMLIAMLSLLAGKQEELHGPNCFSTGMMIQGMISVNRQMELPELSFWLRSPLCRELELNEEPRTGDLIYLPRNGGHLFTFIRSGLVFEKECYFKTCKYQFNSPDAIFNSKDWKVKPECRRVSSKHPPEACSQFGHYFRCESSFEQELTSPGRATPEIIQFHQQLLELEANAMKQMRLAADILISAQNDGNATLQMRKGIEKTIREMKASLETIKQKNSGPQYTLFLKAFSYRLEGLYTQIKSYSYIDSNGIRN